MERLAREHEVLITVEEGSVGGFGRFVLQHLAWRGLLDHGLKVRPMCLPDRFIDHDSPKKQYDEAGLNAAQIVAAAVSALGPTRRLAGAGLTVGGRARPKERADQLLVDRGLVESRTRAQALILAGKVYSGEQRIEKPGHCSPPAGRSRCGARTTPGCPAAG